MAGGGVTRFHNVVIRGLAVENVEREKEKYGIGYSDGKGRSWTTGQSHKGGDEVFL